MGEPLSLCLARYTFSQVSRFYSRSLSKNHCHLFFSRLILFSVLMKMNKGILLSSQHKIPSTFWVPPSNLEFMKTVNTFSLGVEMCLFEFFWIGGILCSVVFSRGMLKLNMCGKRLTLSRLWNVCKISMCLWAGETLMGPAWTYIPLRPWWTEAVQHSFFAGHSFFLTPGKVVQPVDMIFFLNCCPWTLSKE